MTKLDNETGTLTGEEADARWKEISREVELIWSAVMKVADKVLLAHANFGFRKFEEKISPSLDEILLSLRVITSILDSIDESLDYSEIRMVANAKQQILWIQTIGNALRYGNEIDYLASVEKLRSQSNI